MQKYTATERNFWRRYVTAVHPSRTAYYRELIGLGYSPRASAYRALEGVSWDHDEAFDAAHNATCAEEDQYLT